MPRYFPRVPDDHWPIAYWKLGPLKGQPKICMLCPNFAILTSRPERRLCVTHYRELERRLHRTVMTNRRLRSVKFWLSYSDNRKPLPAVPIRATTPNYEGPLQHIPPNWREIAQSELDQLIAKHSALGPIPPHKYARLVACATTMAKFGGRKQWSNWIRTIQRNRTRAKNFLLKSEAASQILLDKQR